MLVSDSISKRVAWVSDRKNYQILLAYPNNYGFYIGFAESVDSIKNYNQYPGYGDNKQDTIGLLISYDNNIYLYDKDNKRKKLDLLNRDLFKNWISNISNISRIKWMISFNLSSQEMILSINNKTLITLKHEFKNIIPIFCLCTYGDELEMIDSNFIV